MKRWLQLAPVTVLVGVLSLLSACGGGGGGGEVAPPPSLPQPTSVDTDKDRVADTADAAPADALCSAASDASNGECHLRALVVRNGLLTLVGNDNGKLFFKVYGESSVPTLYGYDLSTGHFIGRTALSGFTPAAYAYSADHGRVYVTDTEGIIHAYSEALVEQPGEFAKVENVRQAFGLSDQQSPRPDQGGTYSLVAAGKYLMAQVRLADKSTSRRYVFDRQGTETGRADRSGFSLELEWSGSDSRLYYLTDGTSLRFEIIDQANGRIVNGPEQSYGSGTSIHANALDGKLLLSTGDVLDSRQLGWSAKFPVSTLYDAMGLSSNEVLIHSNERLQRYSADFRKLEELSLSGRLLGMTQHAGRYHLIVATPEQVEIRNYVPSDDTDGDGFSNLSDRFPEDKTAAVDTDSDGYPDAFLNSYTAGDSTTKLSLDAYPLDGSCHQPQQGDGQRCNPQLWALPDLPDQMFSDGMGTVYLYRRTERLVYRWSSAAGDYVLPMAMGKAGSRIPTTMALSTAHNRLYVAYPGGEITSIDLSTAVPGNEQHFAYVTGSTIRMVSAGNYLMVESSYRGEPTQQVLDKAGKLTYRKGMDFRSQLYEWDPVLSRFYTVHDNLPNDLMFQVMDQNSGLLTAEVKSPHQRGLGVQGPVRVSADGVRLILGSGDVYSAADLMITASIKSPYVGIADMQWLEDGSLVTIQRQSNSTSGTVVLVYDRSLSLRHEQMLAGLPLAVFRLHTGGVVVFTQVSGKPQFQRLNF